jgi:hypothetical protein
VEESAALASGHSHWGDLRTDGPPECISIDQALLHRSRRSCSICHIFHHSNHGLHSRCVTCTITEQQHYFEYAILSQPTFHKLGNITAFSAGSGLQIFNMVQPWWQQNRLRGYALSHTFGCAIYMEVGRTFRSSPSTNNDTKLQPRCHRPRVSLYYDMLEHVLVQSHCRKHAHTLHQPEVHVVTAEPYKNNYQTLLTRPSKSRWKSQSPLRQCTMKNTSHHSP